MKLYNVSNTDGIILRDYLARDRTMLANERTMLAYMRTALGMFGAGVACVKLIEGWLCGVGIAFMAVSPIIAVVGLARFFAVRRRVMSIPDNQLIADMKARRKEAEQNEERRIVP